MSREKPEEVLRVERGGVFADQGFIDQAIRVREAQKRIAEGRASAQDHAFVREYTSFKFGGDK